MKLSVVTPAFNEAANLEALHARVAGAMARLGCDWEWIVVDDHSHDRTFELVERLAATDPRVRGIRLARNSGSHIAITCGLYHAAGDAAVLLVADLQDPPEAVVPMVEAWQRGAQVVWGVRRRHPGQRRAAGISAVYYWLMRSVVGLTELPAGTDFFVIDRAVIDAVRSRDERNVSIFALIASLGFRQAEIAYDKQPRAAGHSGWTLRRKVDLLVDSVTGFSNLPIRLCTYAGAVLVAMGLVGMVPALIWRGSGGWLVVLAAVVAIGGLQLAAIGLVGEYVWRTLEASRRRPLYRVERTVGVPAPAAAQAR